MKVEVTDAVAPKPPRAVRIYESHLYKPSRTGVHVGDAFVEFTLDERLDVVWPHGKPPPSGDFKTWFEWKRGHSGANYEHRPSGQLGLKITSSTFLDLPRQSWKDGKTQRLENLLNEFVAGLLDAAERHRLWADLRARERLAEEEAERRAKEEAARREVERRKVWDLRRRIRSWVRARHIDELLEIFARVHGPSHVDWVRWATGEAERLRALALSVPRSDAEDEPSPR